MARRRSGGSDGEQQPDDAVRVVDSSTARRSPPETPRGPSARPALIVLAAALLAGSGFFYGYQVGEDRTNAEFPIPGPSSPTVAPSTTDAVMTTLGSPVSPTSTTIEIPAESGITFPVETVSLVRRTVGFDLPAGATDLRNSNLIVDVAAGGPGEVWTAGPGGVIRWNTEEGVSELLSPGDGTGPVGASHIATDGGSEVWVGSGGMLSHWDGERWAHGVYRNQMRREIDITALAAADGSVWVGTIEWGTTGAEKPRSRIHHMTGFSPGDVDALVAPGYIDQIEVRDGLVWALIDGDLWRMQGDDWSVVIESGMDWIINFALDPSGGVWVASEQGGGLWNDGEVGDLIELGWAEEGEPLTHAAWLGPGPGGGVWAVTSRWSEEGGSRVLNQLDTEETFPLPDGIGLPRPVLSGGSLWFGTENGMQRFDGAEWVELRVEGGAAVGWPDSVGVDEQGVVWLGNGLELRAWDGEVWTEIDLDGLGWPADRGPEAVWVASNGNGTLWRGVGCHPVVADDGGFALGDPPGGDAGVHWCWPRVSGLDGVLWVMADSLSKRGLYRFDGVTWTPVVPMAQRNAATAFAVAPDGGLWVVGDGAYVLHDNEWVTMLAGVSFSSITVAGDGAIWAGAVCWDCSTGADALWEYDNGVWTRHGSLAGVYSLVTAADGVVWAVGTDENGRDVVVRQSGGGFEVVMSSEPPVRLAPDLHGGMWAASLGRLVHIPGE